MTGTPKHKADGSLEEATPEARPAGGVAVPSPPRPAAVIAPPPPPLAAFGVKRPPPPPAAAVKPPPAPPPASGANAPAPATAFGANAPAPATAFSASAPAAPEVAAAPPRPKVPPPAAAFSAPEPAPAPAREPQYDEATATPAAPHEAPPAAASSLFDLDLPMLEPRHDAATHSTAVAAHGTEVPDPRPSHSPVELLFELDAPSRTTPREIDLAAGSEAVAELAYPGDSEAAPAGSTEQAGPSHAAAASAEIEAQYLPTTLGSLLPEPQRARTAEEQHEQRLQRIVVRIQTCRDAFRLLSSLGLSDVDRKALLHMLTEIDGALGLAGGKASAFKDPEGALAGATKEQLDAVERLLGPIEDRLIQHDERVPRESFERQVLQRKHTKKVVARYGRLLASRKFQPDERRYRFEWIATYVLTAADDYGLRKTLPPERAGAALQILVGGLPYKLKPEELSEALKYLRESYHRLQQFTSAEEFFESGFYVDVHGYKVTMRDQLAVPEFLYASAVLNAALHNRLEGWIADLERLQGSNELRLENSPREQIERGLRAQEEAVESALGIVRRPTSSAIRPESLGPVERSEPKPKKKATAKKKNKRSGLPALEIVWDRNLILLLGSLVVIGASGTYLMVKTGMIGAPVVEVLHGPNANAISPYLVRARLFGEGDERSMKGLLRGPQWVALDPRARRAEAESILKRLTDRGVQQADITAGRTVVIRIRNGFLEHVEGGKL